jgi:hypothetical protein
VVGSWGQSPHFEGNVNAHSGPAGQNPQGTLFARAQFDAFTGSVTCVLVNGSQATVGAIGNFPGTPDAKETMILRVADGGPSGTDSVGVSITPGATTPPSCGGQSGGTDSGDTLLVVNDAP